MSSMDLQKQIGNLLECDPFAIKADTKKIKLLSILKLLIKFHIENCPEYALWYQKSNFLIPEKINELEEIPFMPSAVFKYLTLRSDQGEVRTIKTSGTSSQAKSQIFINKETSLNQTKCLSKILSFILGTKRTPFFIIDSEPQTSFDSDVSLSARYAGMTGYFIAAKSTNYLLKEGKKGSLILNDETFDQLLEATKEGPITLIGYTYVLWEFLSRHSFNKSRSHKINDDAKLIHFGGWKKLQHKKVDKNIFNQEIKTKLNILTENIFDIYGFSEQLGTVYPAKGDGGSKVSSYSHVIVRDTSSLEVLKDGESGFLQFISPLPLSYPGFSILNDDIGYISDRKQNQVGQEIIEFQVLERLEKSDKRGCGDTLPENYYI